MKAKGKFLIMFLLGAIFVLETVPMVLAAEKEPIRIGIFGPLTGPASMYGKMSQRGSEFAVKEANIEGGIDGREIKLYIYDDRMDRKEAVSVVRKMIELDKVVAIVGNSISSTSIAAAPVVDSMKTPMIASYSNALSIVKGHPYCFRWCSVADVQGYIMAWHATQKKGYKTFALILQDDEFGRGNGNGMEVGLEKFGGKIVYKAMHSPVEKEFRSQLTAIKELNPDAVFVAGFSPAQVAIQGYDLGVFPKAQFYSN